MSHHDKMILFGGNKMETGEKIKEYRLKAGLTQRQLGERVGLSQQMIAKYEGGKAIPTDDTLFLIATALDIPAWNLKSNIETSFQKFRKIYTLFAGNTKLEFPNEHTINQIVQPKELVLLRASMNHVLESITDIESLQDLIDISYTWIKLNHEGQKELLHHSQLLEKVEEFKKDINPRDIQQ